MSIFKFVEKLNKVQSSQIIPSLLLPQYVMNILYQHDVCVTVDEPIVIIRSPQFTVGFTLGAVHSIGLDKCIMTWESDVMGNEVKR